MPPASTDEPEIDDLPEAELAPDIVPRLDDEAPEGSYRDWDPAKTRIVQYRVGNDYYPGEYAPTRDAALASAKQKYGRILEANYVRGRAFFRVSK